MHPAAGEESRQLQGLGVLVTRPEHQADALCQWIESHGGHAIRVGQVHKVQRRFGRLRKRYGAAITQYLAALDEGRSGEDLAALRAKLKIDRVLADISPLVAMDTATCVHWPVLGLPQVKS